jgi:UDP-N-acetylglucosamine 2-epimerase (non-hydrolysing)
VIITYGTTGELIKLAPIVRRLVDREIVPVMVCTGQQARQINPMSDALGIPRPHLWLGRGAGGRDLERTTDIPPWGIKLAVQILRKRRDLLAVASAGGPPVVVVHGDTFTTVIGTLIGRLLGLEVVHVEAGLRSGSWKSPFPEELNRRLVSRLVQHHLCPGEEAVENHRREHTSGAIVDTGGNTVFDNLFDPPRPLPFDVPERFGLVSIHRFELLRRPEDLAEVLEILAGVAARDRLLFVDHPITAAAIADHGLERFFDGDRFRRIPRQPYQDFVSLLRRSAFLVTDSGGSQEECGYLGHPCAVHRDRSERSVGLDGSVLLTGNDVSELRRFLADPGSWRRAPVRMEQSPSDIVADSLATVGPAR